MISSTSSGSRKQLHFDNASVGVEHDTNLDPNDGHSPNLHPYYYHNDYSTGIDSEIKVIALQQQQPQQCSYSCRKIRSIKGSNNNNSIVVTPTTTALIDERSNDSKEVVIIEDSIEPITICIGYIFATKKMNTMSMVMAEASKVKLGLVLPCKSHKNHNHTTTSATVTSTDSYTSVHTKGNEDDDDDERNNSHRNEQYATLTQARLLSHNNERGYSTDLHSIIPNRRSMHVVEYEHHDYSTNQQQQHTTTASTVATTRSDELIMYGCHHNENGMNNINNKGKKKCKKSIISTTSTATTTTSTTTAISAGTTIAMATLTTNGNSTVDDDHQNYFPNDDTRGIIEDHDTIQNIPITRLTYIQPVRISFVPLTGSTDVGEEQDDIHENDDDDYIQQQSSSGTNIVNHAPPPYIQQHSGKIDLILHKLTEDIAITYNKMSVNDATTSTDATVSNNAATNSHIQQQQISMEQIQRLLDYNHHKIQQQQSSMNSIPPTTSSRPMSFILDHPNSVQRVMCRADIARTLEKCLQQCTTTSGIPVRTPKYYIYNHYHHHHSEQDSIQKQDMEALYQQLTFPIIVKPLIAAGTKASHAMTIIMKRNNDKDNDIDEEQRQLQTILQNKVPCLCQEYYNHNAKLYKVYVLGDFISVHVRQSLPNLPASENDANINDVKGQCTIHNYTSVRNYFKYIEFDSQRPYPTLSDFGYDDEKQSVSFNAGNCPNDGMNVEEDDGAAGATNDECDVTVNEVRPIVTTLKQAFQLELFGFDILITTSMNCTRNSSDATAALNKTMMVVDVNYFPSYKEVTNFPTLFAQYLAHRVLSNHQYQQTK